MKHAAHRSGAQEGLVFQGRHPNTVFADVLDDLGVRYVAVSGCQAVGIQLGDPFGVVEQKGIGFVKACGVGGQRQGVGNTSDISSSDAVFDAEGENG